MTRWKSKLAGEGDDDLSWLTCRAPNSLAPKLSDLSGGRWSIMHSMSVFELDILPFLARAFLVFVDNKKLLLVILHGLWWAYDTTIVVLRDGWEMDGGAAME
jgi:hypothetical protein